METLSALLTLCDWNPPVTSRFFVKIYRDLYIYYHYQHWNVKGNCLRGTQEPVYRKCTWSIWCQNYRNIYMLFTSAFRSKHVYPIMFVYLHEIKVLTQMRTRYITTIRVITVRTAVAVTRSSKYVRAFSISENMFDHKLSPSREGTTTSVQISVSLWNVTGGLVSMLLSSLSNIFVTRSLEIHILWLRELTWWIRNMGYWDRNNPNKTYFWKCMKNDNNGYDVTLLKVCFNWTYVMLSEKHPINY